MEEIELRSEEVQEILGTPPSWLVRWGTFFLFLAVASLIGVSWFVQYPDVLEARVQIASATPPVEVVARSEGNIQAFYVTDGQEVHAGQVLGILQSTANYTHILTLDSLVRQMQTLETPEKHTVTIPQGLELGDLQGDYANLVQLIDVVKFSNTDKTQNNEGRIASLRAQRTNLQSKLKLNAGIRQKAQNELAIEQQQFERQRTLYAEGFISLSELQKHQRDLKEIERNLESMRNTEIEVQSQINELDASISSVQFGGKEDNSNSAIKLNESLTNLIGALEKWKQTYLVTAPIQGKISLNAQVFSAQQYVRTGDLILTLAPPHTEALSGKLDLPILGSGKVKIGQKVIIYLDNYPSEEFGTLHATVLSKSAVPKENMYSIRLQFDQGLKTSRNIDIPFEQALIGRAQIVTDSRRLLTRLFDQLFSGVSGQK